MAINKNHEFEELDGVKCAIVEKNASEERVAFLKDILEYNRYKVIVVPSPPPKAATVPPKPASTTEGNVQPESPPQSQPPPEPSPPPPETFTIGVTDVSFSATNAIFGRQLHTRDRHIVTLAYWNQEESVSNDEVPYFQKNI